MPDHRLWSDVPDKGDIGRVQSELVERMHKEHPGVTFSRMTYIEAHGGVWMCLDTWAVQPEDQGPEPTAEDVPVGFA